jgi:hypothetical protein
VKRLKFKSQYKELVFVVKGEMKRFSGGEYETENKDEIEVLTKLVSAQPVKEEKPESPKEEPKQEEKEAPKKPSKKKSSK